MTQSTLAVGSRVKVTTHQGGAFYSRSYDKIGVVTALTQHRVDVRFDDGTTDYGFRTAVTLIQSPLIVGTRVKVTAVAGGIFYSRYEGEEGVITDTGVGGHSDWIRVKFDTDGCSDTGRACDVMVVESIKDAEGFILNTEKTLPVSLGTVLDVLYNDGTLILDLPVGTGVTKCASNNSNSYSATTWLGVGDAGIKAYRFPADRPATTEPHAGRRILRKDVKKGMKVKLVSDNGDHRHWGFKIGEVYDCIDGGIIAFDGVTHRGTNYGDWVWELVDPSTGSLDEQLAALKAELEGVKAEKAAAEADVVTAQGVVDAAEAKRIALIGRLAAHGIQFIGELFPVVTAQEAFAAGNLDVGVTLLCVTPEDDSEHTAGREYKVIQRDQGDEAEFKLESNDGLGVWVENEALDGYTVVVK